LKDGWLDTGDEGFLEGGELFLTGRNRDMIVLRGANYAPEHFEEIIASLEGIGNVAAVGIVTEQGDDLCILAEVRPQSTGAGSNWARVAINEILSAKMGIVPHRVQLLDPGSLPRTSSGKLRRGEAARRYAG
jgi:acyl-CoA synthetase (AMP-forming)/AMP-acid ligase II